MKKLFAALLLFSSLAAGFEATSSSFNITIFDSAPVAENASSSSFDLALLIPEQPLGVRINDDFCLCLGELCRQCSTTASLSFFNCETAHEGPFSVTTELLIGGSGACDVANLRLDVVEPSGGTQIGLTPVSCDDGKHVFQPALPEGGIYRFTGYSLSAEYVVAPVYCSTIYIPAPDYLVFVRDDGAIGCPLAVHEPLNQTVRLQVGGSLLCDGTEVNLDVTYPNGTTATGILSTSCSSGDHRYPLALTDEGNYLFYAYSTNVTYSVEPVSCNTSYISTEHRVSGNVPEIHWLLAIAVGAAALYATRFKKIQ